MISRRASARDANLIRHVTDYRGLTASDTRAAWGQQWRVWLQRHGIIALLATYAGSYRIVVAGGRAAAGCRCVCSRSSSTQPQQRLCLGSGHPSRSRRRVWNYMTTGLVMTNLTKPLGAGHMRQPHYQESSFRLTQHESPSTTSRLWLVVSLLCPSLLFASPRPRLTFLFGILQPLVAAT